ncbi:hypothetical protein FQR65_LT00802 [Abscondita terminalis]|nr:hypothetical protein FQR65_LT00802 [Abscondita terminalis]
MPSQSHHIMGESLLKALADKGHEVTMLSPFPSKNKPRNYNEILIPGVSKGKDEMLKAHIKVEQQDSFIKKATATSVRVSHTEEVFFNLNETQTLINSGLQYDLAIAAYFGNDPVLAFAQRLAKHTIVFCTKGSHYDITKLTKVPAPSSYVPNLFPPLPDEMNLIQRIQNFLASVFYVAFTSVVLNHRQRSIIDRYLPNSPTIDQIHEHISLVLLNTHYSLETPRPYIPQMIQVAGLHLEDSAELTENLKTFMEEATEGAILFSLGSNVRSAELSEKTIQGIIKCFSKLPYKVLWKFDKYDNLNLPKNVIISKWLPQRDLLAHTNMKLFITHGGLLSLTEALYNSVPMIGIPLYGDQSINVAESVLKGYAVTLSFSDLSEEKLCSAITEVMTNTKYRKNMQIRSRIFRDQPVKPLQKAVFWVEYVLRHDGAHHLKTGAFKLHWMQLYSVDTDYKQIHSKFTVGRTNVRKVSLVLLNTHYSLQSPRPTVPQIIQVGGLQLQEPKELTGNLKTIMHEASGGAILFSLGSNVKSSNLNKTIIEDILKCFSKLPYTVLWKFEKSDLLNIPKNVIISDWFPQRDLLAHKNMKLFVTHGGLLSITEAIYNGVPIIGIPFYGDQSANVAESVIKGYGVCVPYLDLSERTLFSAIVEVMNNSKYQNNAQKISRIFKDQPTKPLDTAIVWVEYVLRHEGAHHLKTSALKLHWLQLYLIDFLNRIERITFINYLVNDLKNSFIFLRKEKEKRKKITVNFQTKDETEMKNINVEEIIERALDDAHKDAEHLDIRVEEETEIENEINIRVIVLNQIDTNNVDMIFEHDTIKNFLERDNILETSDEKSNIEEDYSSINVNLGVDSPYLKVQVTKKSS